MYTVIYDGACNLCVTLVRVLEQLDQGQQFEYVPMQDETQLAQWGITSQDCEQGMILLDQDHPDQHRWQGSAAAEEIGRLLPASAGLVQAYRSLPGMKAAGDRFYAYIRDNRYTLFGQRDRTYEPAYPVCGSDRCASL
ncbi:MAG: DUF393 domain-containing protein [Leptolyngbya sp. SIO1D8]|nr:DUF393 domain-containing protein [Leptolyngbya sp. SIO1D8]